MSGKAGSKAKKLEAAYAQLRGKARRSLGAAAAGMVAVTAVELVSEAIVSGLSGDAVAAASVAALAVVVVLVVALAVLEVRAWRATVAACRKEPTVSDKVILGAALWFVGGLPLCVVNLARSAGQASLLAELGVTVVLALLAAQRYVPELRER